MSLPGAGEAEPTTILEELNRSLVSSTSHQEREPNQLQSSQQQHHHQQDNQSDNSDDAADSNENSDDDESCSDDDDDLSENVSVVATVAVQEIVQPNENEKCLRAVRKDSDRSRTTSASDVEDLNASNSDEPEVNSERLSDVHCDIAIKNDIKLESAESIVNSVNDVKLGQTDSDQNDEHHITNAIITDELEPINNNNNQLLLDGVEAVSLLVDEQVKSILNEDSRVLGNDEAEEWNSADGPENGFNIFRQEGYVPFRDSVEREISPPPVPLVTYRWEEARRAREKVKNDQMYRFLYGHQSSSTCFYVNNTFTSNFEFYGKLYFG